MIVQVKAVEGRVAFTQAVGGKRIPNDHYILTDQTPWIDRLAEVHGDIEIVPVGELENKKGKKAKDD